jgi:hypothetical protein
MSPEPAPGVALARKKRGTSIENVVAGGAQLLTGGEMRSSDASSGQPAAAAAQLVVRSADVPPLFIRPIRLSVLATNVLAYADYSLSLCCLFYRSRLPHCVEIGFVWRRYYRLDGRAVAAQKAKDFRMFLPMQISDQRKIRATIRC